MLRKHAVASILSAEDGATAITLEKRAKRAEFEYEPEPGYIYVRSRMISSRCNDNFDEFPAEEIKKAYKTFIGKPVFVNHNNADHRRARGVIIDAALHEHYNPDGSPDVWVEGLMAIDAITYPKLASAILKGEIDKTSMGTDVKFSKCSACGNIAESPADYCQHIPKMKGKKFFRTTASGQKVGEIIREICYGLGFFENSLLVEEPADPTALFLGVDDRGVKKSASTYRPVPEKDDSPHEEIPVMREVNDADRYHGVALREDDTGYYVRNEHDRSESFVSPDAIPDEEISRVRQMAHQASLIKGAPFAGYDSFEACVKANQDKSDPQAYCGAIKHKVEGAKTAAPREDGSTTPQIQDLPRKDQLVSPPGVDTLRDESCPVCNNSDFFAGDRCQVCGFILPPKEFTDPDLTKHRDMKIVDPSAVREDGQVADVTDTGSVDLGQDNGLVNPQDLDDNGELAEEEEPLLECPNCGFQIPASDPTTENTEEEPATLAVGDLCPNCEEADLVPAEELDEELEYEEDELGEFEEEDQEEDLNEFDEDDEFEDDEDEDSDEEPAVDDEDSDQKRQKDNQ